MSRRARTPRIEFEGLTSLAVARWRLVTRTEPAPGPSAADQTIKDLFTLQPPMSSGVPMTSDDVDNVLQANSPFPPNDLQQIFGGLFANPDTPLGSGDCKVVFEANSPLPDAQKGPVLTQMLTWPLTPVDGGDEKTILLANSPGLLPEVLDLVTSGLTRLAASDIPEILSLQ